MKLPGSEENAESPHFAYHPGDDLTVIIDESGTLFRIGEGSALFRVHSIGRADEELSFAVGTFHSETVNLNSVEIRRSLVSERLETKREGIKQTFIVEESIEGSGALRLTVDVDGNYQIMETHADHLLLNSPKAGPMQYDALHVYDANGTVLASRFVESGTTDQFTIEVQDDGAVYPIEIDPLFRPFRQGNATSAYETRPSDTLRMEEAGTVVRIDGDLVAVGVPGLDLYPNKDYDQLRDAGLNLAKSDHGGKAGRTSAMLQLGLAAMGLISEPNIPDVGAVYVFGLIDGAWELIEVLNDWATALRFDGQKFRPTRLDGSQFGSSIALHGNSILIGAPGIKQETWVNIFIGQIKISGPNTAGGLYFFEMPSHGFGFLPRGRHYGLRTEFGYSIETGYERIDFREIGHVTALSSDKAVIASGPSYDPMKMGSQYSGYGPTKLHHFKRNGTTWSQIPHDTLTLEDNDFSGAVIGLHIEGDTVYVLEKENSTLRLWNYHWYPSYATVIPQQIHQWTNVGEVSFSFGEGRLIIGFPNANAIQTVDLSATDPIPNPIALPSGATNAGKHVAHTGKLAAVVMDINGSENVALYTRDESSGTWDLLGTEASPFTHNILSMDLDSSGLALIAPAADNSAHTDLRVLSLNRSLSGTVTHADGTPVPNFTVIASSEPTFIPAHAAQLFDGANFVPFETPPWTINRDWGCGLFFSVDDAFPFLDEFFLEITFTDVPDSVNGQEFIANVSLPLQEYTWYGEERYDTPGFGQGRGIIQNGTVRIPLWFGGSFYSFANRNNVSVVGEWQIRLAMGGADRGIFNYATVSSANLILQEANDTGYRYTFTDADGHFTLEGLPPGRYRATPEDLYSWSRNYKGTTDTFNLETDPIITGAQLEITGAFDLSGTARTLNGQIIPDLPLELINWEGNLVEGSQVNTDSNGAYRIDNLVTGGFTVRTRSPWERSSGMPFQESVYIRVPTETAQNVSDLLIPPMLDPPTVSVQTASGMPAPNTTFTISGPFGYTRSLTTNASGNATLPGWNSQYPYLYPGTYALTGTDQRYDWSSNATEFTYPTGLDTDDNPLPLPTLSSVGSEVQVTTLQGNQEMPQVDILAARVTATQQTSIEGVFGEDATYATRHTNAYLIELGSIELDAEKWDTIRSIDVWHYGGLQEFIDNSISDDLSEMTYELVLPGGEVVELGTPVLEYNRFGTRKMSPVNEVSSWPGGIYQLRIRYDTPTFDVDIWNRWMLRVTIDRNQVDNERVATSNAEGIAYLNDLPGGDYLFACALQDSNGNWVPANSLQPGQWIYPLDTVNITSASNTLTHDFHFERRHTLEGSVRVNGLPIAGATLQAINAETNAILAETLTDVTGEFSLTGVPSGPVELNATLNGYTFSDPSPFAWNPLLEDQSDLQFLGNYAAQVSGTITDLYGNPISSAPIQLRSIAKRFSGTGGPFNSRQWLEFPLTIDTDVQVDSLAFHFHSNYANESIYLVHPSGKSIKITDYNYGLFNRPLTFRDGAPNAESLKQTFGAVDVAPAESLSAFSGLSARGTWIMRVYGVYPNEWGPFEIFDWGITISPLIPGNASIETILYSETDGTFSVDGLPPAFFELVSLSNQLIVSLDTSEFDLSLQPQQTVRASAQLPQVTVTVKDTNGTVVENAVVVIETAEYGTEILTDSGGEAVAILTEKSSGTAQVYIPDSHYGVPSIRNFDFSDNQNPDLSFVLHPRTPATASVSREGDTLIFPVTFSDALMTTDSTIPGEFSYALPFGETLSAGNHAIAWTFTPEDTLRYAATSGTVNITVEKAAATITTNSLARTYDGSPQSLDVATEPAGLPVTITYPNSTAPIIAGSHDVQIQIADDNYIGSATVTLEISKAPVTFSFSDSVNGTIERRLDTVSGAPGISTLPADLPYEISFENAPGEPAFGPTSTVPSALGNYLLTVSHQSTNYAGTATVPYRVLPQAVDIAFDNATNGTIIRTYTGEPQAAIATRTQPSDVALQVLYSGISNDGTPYGPSATPPTLAGQYTVQASTLSADLEGSASAALQIQRAAFAASLLNIPASVTAGTTLDFESLLDSNARFLSVEAADSNTAAFQFVRETVSWGLAAALPDSVIDARPGYSGSGVALLPGGTLQVWNQNGTTLNAVNDVSAISTVSIDGYGNTYAYWLNYDGTTALAATTFASLVPNAGQLDENARGRITSMATGNQHILYLTDTGELLYFANYQEGSSFEQALGTIPQSVPTSGIISVAAGEFHCAVVDATGALHIWGLNTDNQLNVPDFGAATVESIHAGSVTSVAILNDGRAVGWGGQSFDLAPPPGRHWVDVSVGGLYYVALLDDSGELTIVGFGPYQAKPEELFSGRIFAVEAGPQSLFAFKKTATLEPVIPGLLRLEISHDDPDNLLPSEPVPVELEVTKKAASLTLGEGDENTFSRVYTGQAISPPVLQTAPQGLAYTVSYSGTSATGQAYAPSTIPPTNAGQYTVEAVVADPVYAGSRVFSFEIRPATASIAIENDTTIYSGNAQYPTITTDPTGLQVVFKDSEGNPLEAILPGDYPFTAAIVAADYSGELSGLLTIDKAEDSHSHDLPDTIVYGDAPLALNGNTVSGMDLVFSVIAGPGELDANGNLVTTGTGQIDLSLASAGNNLYHPATSEHSVTVQPATANVILRVPEDALYNGGPFAVEAQTTPQGLSVAILYNNSPELPVNAGTYSVSATIDDPRYTGSATTTLSVAKAPVLFFWDDLEQYFDGTDKQPTVRVEPENLGLSINFSGPYAEGEPIYGGTYSYSITASGPNHYGSSSAELKILPRPQSISFAPLANMTFGDAPQAVEASMDSGRDVRTSIVSGPAQLDDQGRIVPTASGTVTVRVEEAISAARDYAPATPVERSFTVSRANAPITIELPSLKTYTGNPIAAIAYAAESNTLKASEISVTYDGSPTPPTDVGTYAIQATGQNAQFEGSASATLVITPAEVGIQSTQYAVYSGVPIVPEVITNPANLSYTLNWENGAAPTDAGSYPYSILIDELNYTGSFSGTLEIAKAQAALSLEATELAYSGSPLSVSISSSPQGIPVSQSFFGGAGYADSLGATVTLPGRYLFKAQVDDPNYFGSLSTYVDILRTEATFAAVPDSLVYNGEAQLPQVTTVPETIALQWALTANGEPVAEAVNVGTYGYTVSPVDPGFTGSASGTFTITPASASVTLSNTTQTYTGQPLHPSALTSPVGLPVAYSFDVDGQAKSTVTDAGTYTVTASISNPNYSGSVSGTFQISAAPDTIAWEAPSSITIWQEHTLSATTSSGKAVAYSIQDGTARLEGNILTLINADPVTVRADVASSANFLDTEPATRTFSPVFSSASVVLGNLEQTYTGTEKAVSTSTTPADLSVEVLYNGSPTPPTDAGSYAVEATVTESGYLGTSTGTLSVDKAVGDIEIESPDTVYTGTARVPSISTSPQGLVLQNTIFDDQEQLVAEAINAGRYRIVSVIDETNYTGTATAEWDILPAPASIVFDEASNGRIELAYTGSPVDSPSVSSTPADLNITYAYRNLQNGESLGSSAPSERGLYSITASVNETNYEGSATVELLLGKRQVAFSVGELVNGEVTRIFSNAPVVLPEITTTPEGIPYRVQFTLEGAAPETASSEYPVDSGRYEVYLETTQPYDLGSSSFVLEILPENGSASFAPPTDTAPGAAWDPLALITSACSDYLNVEIVSGPVHATTFAFWGADNPTEMLNLPGSALQLGVDTGDMEYLQAAVILKNGALAYWGYYFNGTSDTHLENPYVDVAIGSATMLALRSDGTMESFGTFSEATIPAELQGSVVDVAGGARFYLARLQDESLAQWGTDSNGNPLPEIPVLSAGLGWETIDAQGDLAAGIDTTGTLHVWGNSLVSSALTPPNASGRVFVDIAISSTGGLGLTDTGQVYAWGDAPSNLPVFNTPVLEVALSLGHAHAIDTNGALYSWSSSGAYVEQTTHPAALAGKPVRALWVSQNHVLALYEDGNYRSHGQGEARLRYTISNCPNTNDFTLEPVFRVGEYAPTIAFTGESEGVVTTIYTGQTQTLTIQTNPTDLNYEVEYTGTTAAGATFGPTSTPPTEAGTYSVLVTSLNSFHEGSNSTTWQILPANQAIVFPTLDPFDLSNQPLLQATASSGLPVAFSVVSGPANLLGGKRLVCTANQPVVIRATQEGNANYNAATPVEQTVYPQLAASIQFIDTEPVYNGTGWDPATVTTIPENLNVAFTYNGNSAIPNTSGAYEVVATIIEDHYYGTETASFFFQPKVTFGETTFTYTGARQGPSVTIEPFFNTSKRYYQNGIDIGHLAPFAVGDYTYVVTPLGLGRDYSISFSIGKVPSTITFEDSSFTIGQNGSLSAYSSSFTSVNFEVIEGEAILNGSTINPQAPGPLTVRATASGTANYDAPPPVDKTFYPAFSEVGISVSNLSQVFTGHGLAPSISLTEQIGADLTFDGSYNYPVNAGTYAYTVKVLSTGKYGLKTGIFTITRKPESISLDTNTYTYTGTEISPTITLSNPSLDYAVTVTDSEGQPVSPINAGTYGLLIQITDPNHSGELETTFTITPAPVSFAFTEAVNDEVHRPIENASTPLVASTPADIPYLLEYRTPEGTWSPSMPSERGLYEVRATSLDPNFTGSNTAAFVIGARDLEFAIPASVQGTLTSIYSGSPMSLPQITVSPVDAPYSISFEGEAIDGTLYPATSTPPTNAGTYTMRLSASDSLDRGSLAVTVSILPANPSYTFTEPNDLRIGQSFDPLSLFTGPCPDALSVEVISGPVSSGTGIAWGDNNSGLATLPTILEGGFKTAHFGYNQAVAVTPSGFVVSWGATDYESAIASLNMPPVIDVASLGYDGQMALDIDGNFHIWGGQWNPVKTVPEEIQGRGVAIEAGYAVYLAELDDGTLFQWGNDSDFVHTMPTSLQDPQGPGILDFDMEYKVAAAVDANGKVHVWGGDTYTSTAVFTVPDAALSGVVKVAVSSQGVIALKSDGTLVAWGTTPAIPYGVDIDGRATSIELGSNHAHAIRDDGTLVSWGQNTWLNYSLFPSELSDGSVRVTSVYAGNSTAVAQYAGTTLSISGPGQLTLEYTVQDCPNYEDSTITQTFRIGYDQLGFSFPNSTDGTEFVTYNGSSLSPTVVTSPVGIELMYSYSGTTSTGQTYGPIAVAPTNAGQYTVTVASDDPAWIGQETVGLTISKSTQSLSVPTLTEYLMGDSVTLPQLSSAGLPVSYSVVSGPGTVTGNLLHLDGRGEISILATQPGNANYEAALPSTFSLYSQETAQIDFLNLSQAYNGSAQTPSVRTIPEGLAVTLLYDGDPVSPTNVGTYVLSATIDDPLWRGSETETFTITKGKPEVSLLNLSNTYTGMTIPPQVVTVPDGIPCSITITQEDQSATPLDAGFYQVEVTAENENYATTEILFYRIEPAAVTFSISDLQQVYNFDAPLNPTVVSSIPSVDPVVRFFQGSNEVSPTEAGQYSVIVTSGNPNHVGFEEAVMTIAKRPANLFLETAESAYSGYPQLPSITSDPAGLSVEFELLKESTPVDSMLNAGSYTFNATITDSNFSGSLNGSFTITPLSFTATLAETLLTYNGATLEPTILTAPVGVPITKIYTQNSASSPIPTQVDQPTLPGVYQVTISSSSSDYVLSPLQGSLSFVIDKATPLISAPPMEIVYDGSAKSLNVTTQPAGIDFQLQYLLDGIEVGEPTQPGIYTVTVTVEDSLYFGRAYSTLTILDPPKTFTFWDKLEALPASMQDPEARNGPLQIPNILAYAMGVDPLLATTDDLPAMRQSLLDAATLEFRFRQVPNLLDYRVLVEFSYDLSKWIPYYDPSMRAIRDDGFEWVVVPVPESLEKAFFRTRIVETNRTP